jgi:hypothetical protein
MKHIQEIEIFLHNEKIDIFLISESHLVRTSYIKIKGYNLYHAIHPAERARGGSAILIKENIKHYEELKIEEEIMQVTTLNIQVKNKTFNVSSIYCPPRHNLKKEDYIKLFKTLSSNFVIGGDFNAKNTYWGSRIVTPKGKELFEAGKSCNCDFHSGGAPTYWPSDTKKTPDLIDFFVTKGIANSYIHIENSEGLSSDHSPIIITISETIIKKETLPRLTNNKTNWEQFCKIIDERINLRVLLKDQNQLEEELDLFNETIKEAAQESTPVIQTGEKTYVSYPMEIRELVAEKRKARRRWQNHRSQQNKTMLNHLSNKLTHTIKEVKNETITRYLLTLTDGKDSDYSLWKATRQIKRPKVQVPPIKKENDTWARSAKQKADLFAEYLEETFHPLPRQTAFENTSFIHKIDECEIQKVTLFELKQEINKNLNAKKAPGYDLISGQIIKNLPEKGLRKLLQIINGSFRLKYVPRQWKIAEVIMIPKPNKPPNDKKSYRPISILPTMSKLFEKLLLKRMKPIIEERELIPPHQFGFREKHSTIEQVHRITNIIEGALESKKVCSTIFLDVAQAFDKVWHRGLQFKLNKYLPRQYYEILKSYITDRFFRVKFEDEYSDLKKINAGVPQGSVLGPILYLLYTRDLPITDEGTVATFADDTAIMAIGKNVKEATEKLQKATNEISNWTKRWRIKLNETKSTHINFTYQKVNNMTININSQKIQYASTAKYLGMTLDTKLKWKEHVKKKKEELNIKFRKMNWLLGRHSELTIHNKLLLYRQILKPVWTYGIQLWGCTKKSNAQMIQTFQNKVLRCIVNAPWYIRNDDLHRDLQVEHIEDEIKKHASKHVARLQQHENVYIRHMIDNPIVERRLQRRKPLDLVNG